ncbi:MAG: hypothetical protein FWC69_01585 [Defluviitaleaceae bacterium]|nr:hypothetical protein [Defluviitaleaceae bacterium]
MALNWDVLIIGGASGVGKTSVSRQLARIYEVDLIRVDDFQILLEKTTTPEACPAIHYWATNPNWRELGVENAVKRLIDAGHALMPGLQAVIDDHIGEGIPMVLEGDFILPEMVASLTDGRIRSIFIHEPSREQILQNYLAREGGELQEFRADVSHAYGEWLAEECKKYNIQTINPRPWGDVVDRIIKTLG